MLNIQNLTDNAGNPIISKRTGEPVEIATAPLAVTGRFDWTDEDGKRTVGFKPAYQKDDGTKVDARYTVSVAINDRNTLTTQWVRVNFWGEDHAKMVEAALEKGDTPVTAFLEIVSARVSRYVNKHTGEDAFSLNFSDERGYNILKLQEQGANKAAGAKWEKALADLFS